MTGHEINTPSPEFLTRHRIPTDTAPAELADRARYERRHPNAFDLCADDDLRAEKD